MTKKACFKIFCSKCEREYKGYYMGQKEVFSDDKEAKECIEDEGYTWRWVDNDTHYCPRCLVEVNQ